MVFSIVSTIIVDYYIIYLHIIMGNPILTWRIWRYPHDVGTSQMRKSMGILWMISILGMFSSIETWEDGKTYGVYGHNGKIMGTSHDQRMLLGSHHL